MLAASPADRSLERPLGRPIVRLIIRLYPIEAWFGNRDGQRARQSASFKGDENPHWCRAWVGQMTDGNGATQPGRSRE